MTMCFPDVSESWHSPLVLVGALAQGYLAMSLRKGHKVDALWLHLRLRLQQQRGCREHHFCGHHYLQFSSGLHETNPLIDKAS